MFQVQTLKGRVTAIAEGTTPIIQLAAGDRSNLSIRVDSALLAGVKVGDRVELNVARGVMTGLMATALKRVCYLRLVRP